MAKRNNLNGIPHNLTKSYFGTMRYSSPGYMADWLLNAARILKVNTVTLDIINATINPPELESLPLRYHLNDLQNVLWKELNNNGFETSFISEATIKVTIPDNSIYTQTIYCYPKVIDKDGREYISDRIIESASEKQFNPFDEKSITVSLLSRIRRLFS